jgi:hypothetical protein
VDDLAINKVPPLTLDTKDSTGYLEAEVVSLALAQWFQHPETEPNRFASDRHLRERAFLVRVHERMFVS